MDKPKCWVKNVRVFPYLTQIWVETTQHFLECTINLYGISWNILKNCFCPYNRPDLFRTLLALIVWTNLKVIRKSQLFTIQIVSKAALLFR